MVFQELGNLHGVGAVPFHADFQRFQTAGDEEGVEGAQDGAHHVLDAEEADLVDVVLAAADEAGDDVAVTVQVLRRRVDKDISAQFDGPLDVGRAEGVVDGDLAALDLVGHGADAFNVHDFQRRIGRRFQIDGFRVRGQVGFPRRL